MTFLETYLAIIAALLTVGVINLVARLLGGMRNRKRAKQLVKDLKEHIAKMEMESKQDDRIN